MVRGSRSGGSEADTDGRVGCFGNERCIELAGIHAGFLVEPNPAAAWLLMAAIAVCCNSLLGYGARDAKTVIFLLQVLPLIVSISFFLIADIDSPRGGVILVHPENLLSL